MSDSVGSRLETLDPYLYEVMRETGAHTGGIHLLLPGGEVLGFAVKAGMPDDFVRPWRRLPTSMHTPASDAVRERRTVWHPVGNSFSQYFSPTETLVPYRFATVSAPLISDGKVWGALTLIFPASQQPRLSEQQDAAVEAASLALGRVLARAAARGEPLLPEEEARTMRRPPAERTDEAGADAAVGFAERLPEGGLALDGDGRITFATLRAAELLGFPHEALRGQWFRELLPWLRDPVFEDRYRAALVSREPTEFTAVRPPGTRLTFAFYPDDLYPGDPGMSVRVTPVPPVRAHRPPAAEDRVHVDATDEGGPPMLTTLPAGPGTVYELINLAATLTQAMEVSDIVEVAAEPILAMLGAQGLALLALEDGRLQNVGYRGYGPEAMRELDGARMRWMPTPASQALGRGQAAFYGTPEEMDAVYPGMSTKTGKSAWVYLPLFASGRPVGCCVISYEHQRVFTTGQRAFLTSLSGLLAQALDRAVLHDARYRFVRRLQTGFLPGKLPDLPGLQVAARYRSAAHGMEIGGDFYDLIGLGDPGADESSPRAAAAIGDVQGHNATAAALMGQVRTAVHATAGAPPPEVLARTNRLLIDLNAGLFTSCLYAHISLGRGSSRVRLANAGHPPPLLRHPDGRVSAIDVPPGPLLGIVRAAEYPTIEAPLPPGSELLMYTDGLVETPGEDPDVSTARLASVLAGTPRGASVEARADLLLEKAPATGVDDVALLLISAAPASPGTTQAPGEPTLRSTQVGERTAD